MAFLVPNYHQRKIFIYQQNNWPKFYWDESTVLKSLSEVRHLQGLITGKMTTLGLVLGDNAALQTMTVDVLKTSEIEGDLLLPEEVRSSVARRLGMDIAGLIPSDRHVDGVVDMLIDATQNNHKPLTTKRIFRWYEGIFPNGLSGYEKIRTGQWRDGEKGPMMVLSGAIGKEKVHFIAPEARHLNREIKRFLSWFSKDTSTDTVLRAAIAHLWFVTLHPFDEGNGRIARAISDMLLAQSDGCNRRFYSMSAQIRIDRKQYFAILEKTQKGSLDITAWMLWFLSCLKQSLSLTEKNLAGILKRHAFWIDFAYKNFNPRQVRMLNKVFDGFNGKLTSSKWAKMTRCSNDTGLRDIQDLLDKGALVREPGGGRSTSYRLPRQYHLAAFFRD